MMFFISVPLFLCGLNKGLFTRRIQIIHSTISIFVPFILFILTMYDNYYKSLLVVIWNFAYSSEYICIVIANVCYGGKLMKRLNNRLERLDYLVKGSTNIDVVLTAFISVVIHFAWKSVSMYNLIIRQGNELSSVPIIAATQISNICIELESLWRFSLILIVKNRINNLLKALKNIYKKEWFEYGDFEEIINEKDVADLMEGFKVLFEFTNDVSAMIQVSVSTFALPSCKHGICHDS